jgi:tetratricopeptide (TPR) repeat protein/ribosomal protein L40E
MKCPDCGFECLPDDVECLACGVDIVSAAENKEKERIRSIEAAERKEKYDIELKKELGLIPEDDQLNIEQVKGTTLEETFKKKPVCPKCGAERHPGTLECFRCGVIFDKLKDGKSSKPTPKANTVQQTVSIEPVQSVFIEKENESTVNLNFNVIIKADGGGNLPVVSSITMDRITDEDKTDGIDVVDFKLMGSEDADSQNDKIHEDNQTDSGIPTAEPGVQPSFEMENESLNSTLSSEPNVNDLRSSVVSQEKAPDSGIVKKQGDFVVRKKPVPRPTMKTDSTVTIYKRKFLRITTSVFEQSTTYINKRINKLIQLCCGNAKNKRIFAGLMILLIFVVLSPVTYSSYKHVKAEHQKREYADKIKDIQIYFLTHRDEITKNIRKIIEDKQFEKAKQAISKYDIPVLSAELIPVKNYLNETKLAEAIKQIPENSYEKYYKTYVELVKLNPENISYKNQRDSYRLKLADSEYLVAASYLKNDKKNISDLNTAISNVEKALSLIPDSSRYQELKKTLLNEKLLFPEGNGKISMAVRDDGMGGRLYSEQRKITLWINNNSHDVVYINVQYITMIGKDDRKYTYNDIGMKFKSNLSPGEQTKGELYFKTRTSPAKIIFNHLVCGEISRTFP